MQNIFIHGLGQTKHSWSQVIDGLESNNIYNNNYPDLKELSSAKNIDITFYNLYDIFCDYCNAFPSQLNLCGISLGGMLALKYTIDYPQKVNSLILVGVQYKIPKVLFGLQSIVFKCLPNKAFNSSGFLKKDFILLTSSMKNLDFTNKLNYINCNTLLICGEKDFANKNATLELSSKIKNTTTCFIKNANHEVNTSSPNDFCKEIINFYNKYSNV